MHKRISVILLLLAHPATAQWTTIDLSAFANARIQDVWQPNSLQLPEGSVVLGSVPFTIQSVGANNSWAAHLAPGRPLDVSLNVIGATEVHTLINTYYGRVGPYIWLEFFGSAGAYHRKDLVGDEDVRNFLQDFDTNLINNTTTINVVSIGTGHRQNVRLDKQRIVLPAAFHAQTLTRMRLTSTGVGVQGYASIQGLTIRRQTGQANSACAALTVNTTGATGAGPFEVTIPAGGNLDLSWAGPANQALLLLASSSIRPGQNLGGGLILDLETSTLQILFGAGSPHWGLLFHTNAQGTAVQRFSVPGVAVGSTLYLQGLVFDTANTCAGNPGLMTTASFMVRL